MTGGAVKEAPLLGLESDRTLPHSLLSPPLAASIHGVNWIACAVLIGGFFAADLLADEPAAVTISSAVADAVTGLSGPDFSERQAAEKRLLAIGPPAFEPLVAALGNQPGEPGQRIVRILEQIWLQTPEPESDVLERQLETLRLTAGPYQPAVERLLFANHRLREARAVRELRRLNAVIEPLQEDADFNPGGQLVPEERLTQIVLPRSWKGTTADLWHIQRLAHLRSMVVYVIRGNGITPASLQDMHIGFPDLQITERAEVFLGVTQQVGFGVPKGCLVGGVQPGSPADLAGLKHDDIIEKVDGEAIHSFNQLIEALKKKHGYQEMELVVKRVDNVFQRDEVEDEKEDPEHKRLHLTVIGIPWEAKRFRSPPPPPLAVPLSEARPFPLDLPPSEPN